MTPHLIDISRCARCGGDHKSLVLHPRTRAIEIDGHLFRFWTVCPATEQVVHVRIAETTELTR